MKIKLEHLHRYNIFSMRSRLLNLTQSNLELTNERTIEQVNGEIHRY